MYIFLQFGKNELFLDFFPLEEGMDLLAAWGLLQEDQMVDTLNVQEKSTEENLIKGEGRNNKIKINLFADDSLLTISNPLEQ